MTRRPALDGLRAAAVLAVIGSHYEEQHVPGGSIGVQVFFVLSGWLITSLLTTELEKNGRIDRIAFYGRRALRLMPALIVVVAAVVICALAVGPTHNLGWAAPGTLFYINDLFLAMGKISGWLDPTWSLGVEEQFYLAWPFVLMVILARKDRAHAGRWFLGCAIAMLVVDAVTGSAVDWRWTYFTPLGSLSALLMGSGVALCELRAPRWLGTFAFAILAVLCFAAPVPGTAYFHGSVQLSVITSAVVVAWLAEDANAPVLGDRRVRWLGERSYGVYLIHRAVLEFVNSVVSGVTQHEVSAMCLVVSIALAALMYRFVEQPFLRRKSMFAPAVR